MAREWLTTLGGYNLSYATDHTPDWYEAGRSWNVSEGSTFVKGNDPATVTGQSDYSSWSGVWDVEGQGVLELSSSFDGWSNYALKVKNGSTELYGLGTGSNNYTGGSIGFGIDHSIEEAFPVFFTNLRRSSSWGVNNNAVWSLPDHTKMHLLYQLIMGLIPPQYTWESVSYIQGTEWQLSCTYIDADGIGDAEDGQISREYIIKEGTSCEDLFAGMVTGTLYNFLETLEGYRLAVRPYDTYYLIGLKVGDDVEWTDQIQRSTLENTTIGFVVDHENQVGKFFKCIKSSSGGIPIYFVLYSPVMTMPNIDTLLNDVYIYVNGGIDNPDPEEIEEDDDNEGLDPRPDIAVSGSSDQHLSAVNTGFVTMYEIGDTELQHLAIYMWSPGFLNWLTKLYNDPKDVVVGLCIMPVPPTVGSQQYISAGNVSTTVEGNPITAQYKTITFGTLKLTKEFKDFTDYAPYTKVTLVLPYCGSHELNVSDVIDCTLTIKYTFDFLTGTCVAEVDVTNKKGTFPRYFFTGNAAFNIPISSGDYSNIYSSMLSAGTTIGKAMCTYGLGGGAGAAAEAALEAGKNLKEPNEEAEVEDVNMGVAVAAAGSSLNKVVSARPSIQYSTGGGSVAGLLNHRGAFLIVETPIRKKDDAQDSFLGQTSLMCVARLDDCSGYTKCMKAHLDSVNCYGDERKEIEAWLTSGVRFEQGNATPSYTPSAEGNIGIYLMKLQSDKDVIGKTWTDQTLVEGKLLYEQDVMKPKVTFDGKYMDYTYCYIPMFKRFYYIESVTIERNTMTTVNLKCDVLQSHKDGIGASPAMLDRQQTKRNKMMNDPYWWAQQNTKVVTIPFRNSAGGEAVFDPEDESYILTMSGPGGTTPDPDPEPEPNEVE